MERIINKKQEGLHRIWTQGCTEGNKAKERQKFKDKG